MENSKVIQFKSLYDYLGRAAGPELGIRVNKAAKSKKLPIRIKNINNPKYTGEIHMYPVSFLDSYFNNTPPLKDYKFEAGSTLSISNFDDPSF